MSRARAPAALALSVAAAASAALRFGNWPVNTIHWPGGRPA